MMADKPKDEEVRTLAVKLPKNVHRALLVHAVMKDQKPAGLIALALTRFLQAEGVPAAKQILAER